MILGHIKYSLLCLIAWAGIVGGGETAVDPAMSIPLFLKIITYDANFVPDEYNDVTIYILYDGSISRSYKQFLEAEEYFKERPKLVVSGLSIRKQSISLNLVDSIFNQASGPTYRVLLVTDIGKEKIKDLARKTQNSMIRSFSLCPDYISEGLAVGVRPDQETKTILVNIKSARQEGSNYSAHLLKICDVYKD